MKKVSNQKKQIENRLERLSHIQRLAFAASCCERAFPNYVLFTQLAHWGDSAVFRTSLNAVWELIEGSKSTLTKLPTLEQECAAMTPDLDDFSTPDIDVQAAAGQEAAFMISLLLQFCQENELAHASSIASFSLDTIDMYVQVLGNLDPGDPQLDDRIDSHLLMVAELRKQEDDVRRLETLSTPEEMRGFRRLASNPKKSNIGLSV